MRDEEQTYREGVKEALSDIKQDVAEIRKQVTYTNGKVRKLTIALVAVGALAIGLGVNNVPFILSFLGV